MPRINRLEREILATGALQFGEFTAHNGEQGNCKIVLDSLIVEEENTDLLSRVVKSLAKKIKPYRPEIVLPMPEGANKLGADIARELGIRAILLQWNDKSAGRLRFIDQHERIIVCRANRIALIDDVLRTGSSFEQAIESIELHNKDLIGGVVWDRRDLNSQPSLDFEVKSVVERFVPFRTEPGEEII